MIGSTYSIFVTEHIDENLNVYETGNLDVTYVSGTGTSSDPFVLE